MDNDTLMAIEFRTETAHNIAWLMRRIPAERTAANAETIRLAIQECLRLLDRMEVDENADR